jgi:pantoate--beta-alanine ligase
MRMIETIAATKKLIHKIKKSGKTIGFVPTMGYLHEGHLSLVRIARKKTQFVAVSIFVNPAQFGPGEDLAKYPRNMKRDVTLLKKENVDLIFYPLVKEIYPPDYKTYVHVKDLSRIMCGITRPHHFQGVTTIVLKLFNIIKPDIAVFGAKDYQQALIIRRMTKDLKLDVKIITGKIIREKDGLAMSSRNKYLSPAQRQNATVLYRALRRIKEDYSQGFSDSKKAKKIIKQMIEKENGRIDYVVVLDKNNLLPVKKIKKGTLVALAVFFGNTRLIDNTIL